MWRAGNPIQETAAKSDYIKVVHAIYGLVVEIKD